MPNEIVSARTQGDSEPTARGIGQAVFEIVQKAVDEAGRMQNSYDQLILGATVRYAPERFPGADPEMTIVLEGRNKSFVFIVKDTTRETFGVN